jgi:hypothetical protein
MVRTLRMKTDAIQPTQLYISSEKLDSVMKNLRRTKVIDIEPIPIEELDNQIVFVDGHTRAFAAFLLGLSEISVYWEDEELDWDEYRICVKWCKEEGIITTSDLKERVIPHKDYRVLWLDRCKKMQTDMKIKKKTRREHEKRCDAFQACQNQTQASESSRSGMGHFCRKCCFLLRWRTQQRATKFMVNKDVKPLLLRLIPSSVWGSLHTA